MKSKIMLLTLAGGTALLFAADSPKKEPAKIEQLQAKITALEERVTALEACLTVHPEFIHLTPSPALSVPGQQMPLNYLEEPPNIGSIDVNGLKFFWVPIDSTESQ
jgi:hypothetical protein